MNVENLIKDNLEISGMKLEIISEKHLGVALDDFVLKEKRQDINKAVKETLISQQKRSIKFKRVRDKEEQENGTNFMITTAAAVQEV